VTFFTNSLIVRKRFWHKIDRFISFAFILVSRIIFVVKFSFKTVLIIFHDAVCRIAITFFDCLDDLRRNPFGTSPNLMYLRRKMMSFFINPSFLYSCCRALNRMVKLI